MVGLMYYRQMSQEKITQDVKWENGPKISISEVTSTGVKYSDNVYASFYKGSPSILSINKAWAKKLENATGSEKDALIFLLAVTILHEYVH
jgi:hypothetical protein